MTKKTIKMKDIILGHYQKVHELDMHGLTVRVWKPRTMQQLPAYNMLAVIDEYAENAEHWCATENKAEWFYGNPDWGMWDALIVRYVDPRRKTLDIYVAAILVRPFSREAYDWYNRHHVGLEQVERLLLMWDSREYDRIHGFDTSYGAYKNQEEADAIMYRVVNEEDDIKDTSPTNYPQYVVDDDDEFCPVKRVGMTLRQAPDGGIEFHAINNGTLPFKEYCDTPLIQDFGKCYVDFRKQHPEVTEMRFYTDELVNMPQDE